MTDQPAPLERIATGVPGLDTLLGGGLWKGCVYLVQGAPGSGKTILANQLCVQRAREGARALYVSLLAESFAGMLQHLRRLSFFDPGAVGERVIYISGFAALEEGGLAGIVGLLRNETQRYGADLVVLDTLLPAREAVASDLQYSAACSICKRLARCAASPPCCSRPNFPSAIRSWRVRWPMA